MKLRWYDRLLVALSGLVLLAIAVLIALVGCGTVSLPAELSVDMVRGGWRMTPLFVLAALVVAAWGIHLVLRSLRSKKREKAGRYFEVSRPGNRDELSISVQALDHLVRRCVEQTPGVLNSSIRIEGQGDGLCICMHATLCADVRIPQTVELLQSQIREYIQECAGIEVKSVQVVVENTKIASGRRKQEITPLLPAAPKALEENHTAAQRSDAANEQTPDEFVEPELIPVQEQETIPAAVNLEAQEIPVPVQMQETQEEKEEKIRKEAREELDAAIGVPETLPVDLSTEAFPFPGESNE